MAIRPLKERGPGGTLYCILIIDTKVFRKDIKILFPYGWLGMSDAMVMTGTLCEVMTNVCQ